MNSRSRFVALVAKLRRTPGVVVESFTLHPPAQEADIAAVEKHLGYALDDSIKAFYREMDGLELAWMKDDDADGTPDDDDAQGAITILPIRDAFVDHDWLDNLAHEDMKGESQELAGVTYDRYELGTLLRPFDVIDDDYYVMSFFLGTRSPNPPVILGSDYYACFTDSRITDLSSYIAAVLRTAGTITARKKLFDICDGHALPPLRGTRTLKPVKPWWNNAAL